jgi:hypothetical protein
MEFPPRGSLAWAILHDQRRYRLLRRALAVAGAVLIAVAAYLTMGGWGAIGFWLVAMAVLLFWPMGSEPR